MICIDIKRNTLQVLVHQDQRIPSKYAQFAALPLRDLSILWKDGPLFLTLIVVFRMQSERPASRNRKPSSPRLSLTAKTTTRATNGNLRGMV